MARTTDLQISVKILRSYLQTLVDMNFSERKAGSLDPFYSRAKTQMFRDLSRFTQAVQKLSLVVGHSDPCIPVW